uniref:polysaccharide biosynthesis protein n=1 Tax=uncultured Lutibacter sp. TaxID=437739 RepID=UPI002630718C
IHPNFNIPLSILVIHFLLNVLILIFSRHLFKALYRVLIEDSKIEKRVLIYGAGEAGLLTYGILKEDNKSKTQIIGFIDDNKNKTGRKINRLQVYSSAAIDGKFIISKRINEIIIAIQTIQPIQILALVDRFADLAVEVKIVPPTKDWIGNELKLNQIKSVNVEDLLGRTPIQLDNQVLKRELNDKVILITGAAGSIGSEIARQVAGFNYKHLILIDQAESELYNLQQYFHRNNTRNCTSIVTDVRNYKRMDFIFEQYQPNIVFHAAAYKHVPFMEANPYEAVRVNISGTKNIAELAIKYHAEKFVMVSTDKAVNPTNVMGATKRIAEMQISCLQEKGKTKFITTRFGNVLGSNGSVIPLFKQQIKNGGPLTVTHKDITRYFMTIPEACQLVLEAGAMGNGGEIFVFDMGESVKIYDLALNMIRLSGLHFPKDIDIKIIGLRPGEKIYEELLGDGENTKNTYHDKIMIAEVKPINIEKLTKEIAELCEGNEDFNEEKTILKMKKIVPEFISNNSKYEVLDVLRQAQHDKVRSDE